MLFFSRLTDTSWMPGSLATLFSTLAEQAEQVMPVMSNCSLRKIIPSFLWFVSIPIPGRGMALTEGYYKRFSPPLSAPLWSIFYPNGFCFSGEIQSGGFALQRGISGQKALTLRGLAAILQSETIKQTFNRSAMSNQPQTTYFNKERNLTL